MLLTQVQDCDIDAIIAGGKKFRNMKLSGVDFSGKDLRNADFRNCTLNEAKFVGANCHYANFECANLIRADFTKAVLQRANFKNANLSFANMDAADLFGITVTLVCESFQGVKVPPGHWAGWLIYGLLMTPPSPEAREKLIQAMGIEYWNVLRKQYAVRQF